MLRLKWPGLRSAKKGFAVKKFPNRGSAAIAAVVVLSILIVLGSLLSRLMKTEAEATINFRDGIAAQSIAEAGLRRAIVVLYKNGDPNGLAETVKRENFAGSYRVSTATEAGFLRVRSVGSAGSTRRTASVLVSLGLESAMDEALLEMMILSWSN